MQALAHLVHLWGQRKLVFVASTRVRDAASIPITRPDGAVPKFVETYYLVVSTPVRDHVTKGSVVLARSVLMRVAIAGRSRSRFFAATGVMSTLVRSYTSQMVVTK